MDVIFLAQNSPGTMPGSVPPFLEAAFWVLGALGFVVVIVDRVRAILRGPEKSPTLPQPLVTSAVEQYMRQQDALDRFTRHEAEIQANRRDINLLKEQLHHVELRILDAGEERAKNLHQRLDSIEARLERVVGYLEGSAKTPEKR